MSARIIPFDYDGQPVRFNAEGWLHATEIAERFGKHLRNWLDSAETLEYVRAWMNSSTLMMGRLESQMSEIPDI